VSFQSIAAAQIVAPPLAVSVIKSSLPTVKEGEGADSEKNGFSQSSGEESPIESAPQLETKLAVTTLPLAVHLVKQPPPSQVISGTAVQSSGKHYITSKSPLIAHVILIPFTATKHRANPVKRKLAKTSREMKKFQRLFYWEMTGSFKSATTKLISCFGKPFFLFRKNQVNMTTLLVNV